MLYIFKIGRPTDFLFPFFQVQYSKWSSAWHLSVTVAPGATAAGRAEWPQISKEEEGEAGNSSSNGKVDKKDDITLLRHLCDGNTMKF